MSEMDKRPLTLPRAATPAPRRTAARRGSVPHDRFFRHIVDSMRNGVIALRHDRSVALMNDEAYRIRAGAAQRKTSQAVHGGPARAPDAVRALAGALEMSHPPNRAEVRLKWYRSASARRRAGPRRPR
jgi:hypothetical protein